MSWSASGIYISSWVIMSHFAPLNTINTQTIYVLLNTCKYLLGENHKLGKPNKVIYEKIFPETITQWGVSHTFFNILIHTSKNDSETKILVKIVWLTLG